MRPRSSPRPRSSSSSSSRHNVEFDAEVEAAEFAEFDDVDLRNQAVRAAKSACCNCAEGAGKVSRRDKARSFTVARSEAVEAAATVEIAADCGNASIAAAVEVLRAADQAVALLTGLIRR